LENGTQCDSIYQQNKTKLNGRLRMDRDILLRYATLAVPRYTSYPTAADFYPIDDGVRSAISIFPIVVTIAIIVAVLQRRYGVRQPLKIMLPRWLKIFTCRHLA